MTLSHRLTRIFLWVSVIGGGFLLGAKVFDTVVLAGAWNHAVPDSLRYLPYGKDFPIDTGSFFIPVSALLLISNFGAAISGWRTPWSYRAYLVVPALGIFAALVFTVVVFWPMNASLWYFAHHRERVPNLSVADVVALGRQWVWLDWGRIAVVAVFLLASLRAFGLPFPEKSAPRDPLWVNLALGAFVVLAVAFVIYFVGNV
ncbi:hypothetical protein AEAC466_20385 [Asticcacaulis sp. AC466]|uniref:DUF1772 domain-containing protein n=1 Tax=Asticcacaulis sp. AC466 TaxID=1282362 RepID=UPI0003C3B284|nr:DUF1772 domain-containing protein [Asticcacaulis sp. AC466]ESQ81783.1 hypothetical protein AEAC466_20385 [Asticcacaulis sp. AC466]